MKTNQNTRLLDGKKDENVVTLSLGGRGCRKAAGEGECNKKFLMDTPSSVLWTPSPSRGEGNKEEVLNKGTFRAPLRSGFTRHSSFPSPRRTGGVGNIGAALYPRQRHSGMTKCERHSGMTNAASGFTLIELLVVVLIIGILASVALPQYNKAVRKARLSEVATIYSAFAKAIDVWLLESGTIPTDGNVFFTGTYKTVNLDIAQTCATEDNTGCYTKVGKWVAHCGSIGVAAGCTIELDTNYDANKTSGNKWLEGKNLEWRKFLNSNWGLFDDKITQMSTSLRKEICLWWTGMYSGKGVIGAYGGASTACN